MKRVGILITGAGATLGVLQGCAQDRTPLTPANADKPATQHAVDSIASARCDRAQRCGQIRNDGEYATRAHCMNVMQDEAKQTVGQCRQGIDRGDVEQCVGEIANQDCGTSLESLQTWVACQTDDLCLG
jgi:hypothetical protein